MYSASALLLLVGSAFAVQRNYTTIQPSGTFDPAAATAVQTHYPKDHHIVRGRLVDHMWTIVLDHADFDEANDNEDLKELAKQGILLDNYYAVDSTPQANYLAMIGGDTFGLTEERFVSLPNNVSTLVESMEAARVLWAQYTEDQPFTAYNGWQYPNENPTYSRAKNPFAAFDSIMDHNKRFVNLRSLATMENDFKEHKFPQWLFIRPNLNHDGTNTDLATAAKWVRDFLKPHLETKSKYHRHMFIVTFARASKTTGPNRVWTVILGDMHKDERGTVDHTFYDHYSIAASTQANYDLPSLGRYDCSANVFRIMHRKAHQKVIRNPDVNQENFNQGPYVGYLSDSHLDLPVPNLNCEGRGRSGVLKRVRKIWKKAKLGYETWQRRY